MSLNRSSVNGGGDDSMIGGDDVDSIDDEDDDENPDADINNDDDDDFRIYDHSNNFVTSKALKSASVWSCDWHLHNIPEVHIKYCLMFYYFAGWIF
jgi:hypothetical protein